MAAPRVPASVPSLMQLQPPPGAEPMPADVVWRGPRRARAQAHPHTACRPSARAITPGCTWARSTAVAGADVTRFIAWRYERDGGVPPRLRTAMDRVGLSDRAPKYNTW